MATTSEQLAQAVSAINTLNQTYTQEVGKWQTERNSLTALLANAVAAVPNLKKQFFVDSVGGLDTNEGTSSKPFQTIDKALGLAALINAGVVDIFCKPGVYDVNTNRSLNCIFLTIAGTLPEHVNNVIINWRAIAIDVSHGSFSSRYCTINRMEPANNSEHNRSIVKLQYGGSAVFGSYNEGAVSATNRAFHYISNGCPLFSTQNSGAFVTLEGVYAENTNARVISIASSRTMMLLYKLTNTVLSNFTTTSTELKHVRTSE